MSRSDTQRIRLSGWEEKSAAISQFLPEVNFITIHYGYFISAILAAALVLWGSSTPFRSVSFTDSLFICASAMTEAGLNTINLSQLNTFQQFILFFLILIGSAVFVSIFVVLVRLRAFERQFAHSIQVRRELRERGRARRVREKALHRKSNDASMPRNVSSETGDDRMHRDSRFETADHITSLRTAPSMPIESSQALEELHTAGGAMLDPEMKPALQSQGENTGERMQPWSIRFDFVRDVDQDERSRDDVSPSAASTAFRQETSPHSIGSRNAPHISGHLRRPFVNFSGVGAAHSSSLHARSPSRASRTSSDARILHSRTTPTAGSSLKTQARSTDPWFSSVAGFFARNSAVHNLSMQERQQLGGCEYSALLVLAVIVPLYYVAWLLLGAIACGTWVESNRPDTARQNGLNPFWVGAFNAVSAFNNSGMSLLDANMTAFRDSYFLMLSMGLFILAGNTAYPIFLRVIIWMIHRALPNNEAWKYDKDTLSFLLNHPRRCYTNLFPSIHTRWLALCLFVLNAFDWAMFEILNLGNDQITKPVSTKFEVMDGLFQALAVRSGGFYVVTISATRIALQVLYVVMMYVSAYPVAITMRNSNVYEERSLGICEEDLRDAAGADFSYCENAADATPGNAGPRAIVGRVQRFAYAMMRASSRQRSTHFVRQQLRAQLSHDAWWICLAVFLIMIVEGARFETDPVVFSCFNVIFEVVSAYGCVGISVGVPWAAYSFCGAWHTLSKLILTAVMIRGRHRGLPVAIDHAVNLPGQQMWMAEEDDGRRKLEKSCTLHEGQV